MPPRGGGLGLQRWLSPRVAAWLLLLVPVPAYGQDWLFLEGVADGEFWATDSGSALLTRNDGHPALLGRLQLFGGVVLRPELQLLVTGELEGGKGGEEGKTEVSVDQLVLRYLHSSLLVIDIGKFPTPVGTFSNRRFSPRNPLIGSPDGFPVTYPWGVVVGGTSTRLDYRAALVSLPYTHEDYVPDPSPAPHLVLGGGFTPLTGLRIGASFTRGPYLGRDLDASLPSGTFWQDYSQQVFAFDGRFSRGYFEFYGELALSRYEVPTRSETLDGIAYYGEFKFTWWPRFFTAVRLERNQYASIVPVTGGPWDARLVNLYDGEVGVGYRLWPRTLVKLSYRWDHWPGDANQPAPSPDGHALALQLSQRVDVTSIWARRQ